MPWEGILGHERLLASLSRSVAENRLPPSLLFYGPAGVGKLTAAFALCRCVLCDGPPPGGCGTCDACRRLEANALLHPDVAILRPGPGKEGSPGRESDSPAPALDLHALQDEIRDNSTWRILVEPTRQAVSLLSLSPILGRRRILLVLAAERLGDAAGNALLKALEEPPGESILLLLSESYPAILPTIRSRCQPCRFGPLPRPLMERFLRERLGPTGSDSRLLPVLTGGRPGFALSLAQDLEEYRSLRDILIRLLAEVRKNRTEASCLAAAAELLSQETEVTDEISILMDLVRDAMLLSTNCRTALLSDPATEPGLRELHLNAAEAAFCLARVERAREDLRRYVNPQVALEALFLDFAFPAPYTEVPP
ncbi:MAG TPA: DNA polymerase III subunit [Candidatus Polarisedimenticolia bacterium]|nr:DNA polymerase III subunit [Candidatus Polarisedimenticolia bacterium]